MLYEKKMASPLGELVLLASDQGIRAVLLGDFAETRSHSPESTVAKNHPLLKQCEKELQEYFSGKRKSFSVPLDPQGTPFQKKVWSALMDIPYGKIESYSDQAKRMGTVKSVRAIAAANGRNLIAIIIPCHRVIAATGHLHGYAGGLSSKQKLLEIEGLMIKDLRVT